MAQRRRHRKPQSPAKLAQLRVDEIGARGDGVAYVEGKSVYIPYAAPGDTAMVEVRGDRGALKELIKPGPQRAEPPCQHYGRCGGCALQHISDTAYGAWKRDLAVAALAREGFEASIIAPLITCPAPSRRRAIFSVIKTASGVVLGFNQRRSEKIEPVDACKILHPALAARLGELKALASAVPAGAFSLGVTLCDNSLDVNIAYGKLELLSADEISGLVAKMRGGKSVRLSLNGETVIELQKPAVTFGGVRVTPPPGGFLQASKEGETVLADIVLGHMRHARRIADLFSGCGTFTFPLAAHGAVDAFDNDRPAVAALDAAARATTLPHPVQATVQNLFERPLMPAELKPYDGVVFDPPRAGARLQAEQLGASGVASIVGVSCNPSTFARDAAILRAGGYTLTQVTPVDQFVYSPHVELVGCFQKE